MTGTTLHRLKKALSLLPFISGSLLLFNINPSSVFGVKAWYSEEEIRQKVDTFRQMLMEKEGVITSINHTAHCSEDQRGELRLAEGYVEGCDCYDREAASQREYSFESSSPPRKEKKKKSGKKHKRDRQTPKHRADGHRAYCTPSSRSVSPSSARGGQPSPPRQNGNRDPTRNGREDEGNELPAEKTQDRFTLSGSPRVQPKPTSMSPRPKDNRVQKVISRSPGNMSPTPGEGYSAEYAGRHRSRSISSSKRSERQKTAAEAHRELGHSPSYTGYSSDSGHSQLSLSQKSKRMQLKKFISPTSLKKSQKIASNHNHLNSLQTCHIDSVAFWLPMKVYCQNMPPCQNLQFVAAIVAKMYTGTVNVLSMCSVQRAKDLHAMQQHHRVRAVGRNKSSSTSPLKREKHGRHNSERKKSSSRSLRQRSSSCSRSRSPSRERRSKSKSPHSRQNTSREKDSEAKAHHTDTEARARRRSRSYSPIRKRRRDSPSFMEPRRITRTATPC
ncbi:UNVERIFIED_CONTAM: hypothetical protein FKN15_005001 [Acipenser sinensis]